MVARSFKIVPSRLHLALVSTATAIACQAVEWVNICAMKNVPAKDPLAQALGRKRWAGKSKKQRLEHVSMMNRARLAKLKAGQEAQDSEK